MGLMKGGFEELNARLEAATTGLGGVARKRVFARNTFFVDGKLFALVWREGRIGVKLPEPDGYAELQAHAGALPWIAWGRPMVGWLLVPTEMHSDEAALSKWVRRACEAVRLAAPAPAHETVVGAVEPLPAVASAPAARAPSVRPPKAPSAAPPPPGVLRLVALGGWGEIGMNCLVLEQDEGSIVIDCGVTFPSSDLGIDVVHPRFDYLLDAPQRLRGIVLTHGHEDHIGALGYLLRRLGWAVPVYGRPLTLRL